MPPRTSSSKSTKTKATPNKKSNSTGVSKLHALEKKLAQRDAEMARLSAENQLLVKDKELRAAELQVINKETEQRNAELAVINSIQTALASKMDFQGIIDIVGDKLNEIFKDGNVGFGFLNKEREVVTFPYVVENGKRLEYFELTLAESSLMRHVLKRRRPVVMNSRIGDKFDRTGTFNYPGKDEEAFKFWVSVPIFRGNEIIGGISLRSWERESAFSDSDIRFLQTIANSMSVALENARLFDETQRLLKETEQRNAELAVITSIQMALASKMDFQGIIDAVGDKLSEIFEDGNVGIGLVDEKRNVVNFPYVVENGKRLEFFAIGLDMPSVLIHSIKRRRPLLINKNISKRFGINAFFPGQEQHELKAWLSVPLISGDKFLGGIALRNWQRENAYSESDVRLLQTIANSLSVALENVNLFDETQRLLKETEQRATELQIINNIGQTLTESGDLKSMIQRVGERIQEALKINNVAISIFDKENERVIAPYMVRNGEQIALTEEIFDLRSYKIMIRASARRGGVSWVVKGAEVEKFWHRWRGTIGNDVPKSVVVVPLLAGREVIGGISLADYEKEDAFTDLSVNLLETIASNMGTAVQNVRLFDETKRLFAEAEEARAAAEQANKAKSTFLANMSHELRTPLNAIMGFTQIVKGKAEGTLPDKQISNLDKVLTSSQHLLGLINTVLDIAKIEAGRMDVIPGKFSLGGFADQCLALATPLLKPNVTLEKQVDETIGWVFNDQDKIKQIVLNLLSNAAKFTHQGKIILKVEKLEGEIISISVKDSGIGISEEALGRVFEEFQQAEMTTTRQYGGTGLGLTISRNLARLLGGDLTADSIFGQGSTFTLTFPMKYQKDSASSAAIVEPVHSAESMLTEVGNQVEAKKEASTRKIILLVEDTELNINFITQLLEDDYELIFAKNGAQGVTLAELEKPDLILMDISLPIMDGYEATRRIRSSMVDIPIIGLSAYAMVGDAEKAKEAGCNDYITKPVDANLLKTKIKEYLR